MLMVWWTPITETHTPALTYRVPVIPPAYRYDIEDDAVLLLWYMVNQYEQPKKQTE